MLPFPFVFLRRSSSSVARVAGLPRVSLFVNFVSC
jgi:hypothetical protein